MQDRHRRRICLYTATTVLIMICIFLLSAQDGEQSDSFSDGFLGSVIGSVLDPLLPELTDKGLEYDIRKYAHMFEYCCLTISGFLLFYEILLKRLRRFSKAEAAAFALSFLYACTDEWHQRFVPGRAGRFSDVLVDSVGACAALALILLVCCIRRSLDKTGKEE